MDPIRAEQTVFRAIADPTRRELIHLLAEVDELPLHAMTTRFDMGRTAVSKHLGVLREAGLVLDRTVGRETRYRLNPAPLRQVYDWVSFYEKFWSTRLVALHQLLEEERTVEKSVSLDFRFRSSMERVWFALTDPATLSQWMLFKVNEFEAVVGYQFQFHSEPVGGWDGIVRCEVLEVDAPRRLSYTWIGGPEALMLHTTVTWTLKEIEPGVTQLHLEQSGFNPEAKQAIGGAQYGWTRMLEQLQTLLAD